MFSGKTDALLDRVEALERARVKVITVRPDTDSRSPAGMIASHSGRHHSAAEIGESDQLGALAHDAGALAIDELHFFDDSVIAVIDELRAKGTLVIAAGLDFDFRRCPFSVTDRVAQLAEKLTLLRGTCSRCGGLSTVTQRFLDSRPAPLDDVVLRSGGGDIYEPRCASCYEFERRVDRRLAI